MTRAPERPIADLPLTLHVSARVFDRLGGAAREAGLSRALYAQRLFDAAYAAKVGHGDDRDIDRMVSLVALLEGRTDEDIAAALGCTTDLVARIRAAWRHALATGARA